MPILNSFFDKPSSEDVTKSLGNILISGTESDYRRKLYYNVLMDFLHEKKTLVLVNGSMSVDDHKKLAKFIKPHMIERSCYDINICGSGYPFDVLSAFDNSEEKADFIVSMMTVIADFSSSYEMKAKRFYRYVIEAFDTKAEKYSFRNLSSIDIEKAVSLVSESDLSVSEKEHRVRFLEDTSTYSIFLDIETCMEELKGIGLIDLLSGEVSIKDMLKDGNVIMLNGFLSDKPNNISLLFDAVFRSLVKFAEKYNSDSRIAFVFKDDLSISKNRLLSVLKLNNSYRFASYVFIDDISEFLTRNGSDCIEQYKAFLVFNQSSYENAVFWSAHFGNRDFQERSFSYTKKKGLFQFGSITDRGGVIASPKKYDATTTNLQKVNRPIYRPEIFAELKPNEVMCYLKNPIMRRKRLIGI